MIGYDNLTGRRIGTLEVLGFGSRNPELKWNVRCQSCGSSWLEPHRTLSNGAARCRNNACGRAVALSRREFMSQELEQLQGQGHQARCYCPDCVQKHGW